MSNSYTESAFYRENIRYSSRGTRKGKTFSRIWARCMERMVVSTNNWLINQKKSYRRQELKRIDIDSDDELIEEIEANIADTYKDVAHWYWFD